MLLDKSQGLHAVARLDDRVATGFEEFARDFTHVVLVFREQNGFCSAWRLGRSRRRNRPIHGLVDSRKINLEGRSPAQFAVHPDEAAALLDYAVDRGQAQARAFALRLRGEERLKNVRLRLQAHARACVGDAQKHIVALADNRMLVVVNAVQFGVGGFDDQLSPIRHGVARVDHEVHDDLFHLAGVSANGAQRLRSSHDQLDVFTNQPREQPSHLTDDIIQIHNVGLQNLQPAEGQKLARQTGSAIRGPFDLLNLSGILAGGRQLIAEKLRVAFDNHQKIVEIVRHSAGQAAHRFHFLRLAELLLKNVPLADVLRDDKADSLARILQLMNRGFDFDNLSVLLPVFPMLAVQPVAAFFLEITEHFDFLFLGRKIKNGHAFELFLRVAVHANGRFIHFQKSQSIVVDDPSGKRIVTEEQPEHLFLFSKGILGAAPLDGQGDVSAHRTQKLQVALVVGFLVFVLLDDENSNRFRRGLERNTQPSGRRRANQLHFPGGGQPVEFTLRNEHGRALAENVPRLFAAEAAQDPPGQQKMESQMYL